MGEFTVDSPMYDDKMGETASQKPALEVSVSFGRFENDSLAWEKWSTFSPNKYLEEVEKFATPGSVAQKRAYFEAHYKKVAARKAELLAQEREMEKDPLRSDVQNGEIPPNDSSTFDSTVDASNSQSSSTEEVKQETVLTSEVKSAEMYNPVEAAVVSVECRNITIDDGQAEGQRKETENETDSKTSNREQFVCVQKQDTSIGNTEAITELHVGTLNDMPNVSEVREQFVCVQKQDTSIGNPEAIKELHVGTLNDMPNVSEVKVPIAKLDLHKASKKVPFANKGREAAKSKKVVSPVHKATPISAKVVSRVPKVTQTPVKVVASGSSAKRGNSLSLSSSRSKYTPTAASKGVPNKSLHMSLNLSASSPGSASPTTTMRKSLILEKMGDKDIVKRVFKTFQNNLYPSKISAEDGSSGKNQVPTKGPAMMTSAFTIGRKENGRRSNVNDVDRTGATSTASTFCLNDHPRTEKRKEKLVEKSNSKVTERATLLSKSQVGGESEIKKVRQSMNFKATPMPGFYQKQKLSQSTSDKGNFGTAAAR